MQNNVLFVSSNGTSDFSYYEVDGFGHKYYYNENDEYSRLNGPAIECFNGDKDFVINDYYYANFIKDRNILSIFHKIIKLLPKYENYIQQNIINVIKEHNPQIVFVNFNKEEINQLPDWLKDIVII